MKETFTATLVRDRSMCFIRVPFDPKPVFGKVRAPVKVTLNGYTYRSTIASMGDGPCRPETRARRLEATVQAMAAKPPRAAKPTAKPRLNAAWHDRHPMPAKPTVEQRIAWHRQHEEHCACRPMPAKLKAMIA